MASKTALVNRPDIFEVMDLPSGASRVSCSSDSRVPNCGTFTIYLEDHTIGNLINMQLLKDPTVIFAAYQVPHPLENKLEIRVQATEASTPYNALYNAVLERKEQTSHLKHMFSKQLLEFRSGRRNAPL